MPRLNLDIFSNTTQEKSDDAMPRPRTVPKEGDGPRPDNVKHPSPKVSHNNPQPSPRFIPVGFLPEHLQLLDLAVLKLRQNGHWRASKSGIIRALIEQHKDNLDAVWRKQHEKERA